MEAPRRVSIKANSELAVANEIEMVAHFEERYQ
jgi:hypothetical protein